MTNNPDTLAPMNLVEATAAAWLYDAARAAKLAELHLADIRVRLEAHHYVHDTDHSGDLGQALNRPSAVVWAQHNEAMADLRRTATQTYRTTVAWYARSATLALEAVLAGTKVTARELETRTLRRLLPNGQPQDREDWWPAPTRPPLPPVGDLMTGHEDIDRAVLDAYIPLTAAYQAADQVASADEELDDRPDGYITDWEAAEYHGAEERARPLWDLLLVWANAVDFAARYGRSPARGHKPADQSCEAVDR